MARVQQYKLCLMDADAKRPGTGRPKQDTYGQSRGGVKNWQNLADVFYGWPLPL